jgi:hypothetical protein
MPVGYIQLQILVAGLESGVQLGIFNSQGYQICNRALKAYGDAAEVPWLR